MPEERSKLFIDTDAFVALVDSHDAHHNEAGILNEVIEKSHTEAFTSNFTLGESITVISQNVGHPQAVAFADTLLKSNIMIIDTLRHHAITALHRFSKAKSKNVRFTDFVNIILMEELGISTIFSFDRHYRQAGFTLLTPQTVL